MTWFIFVGDMAIMLFMVVLVTWVFMVSPDSEIESSANIPLNDEVYGSDTNEEGAIKKEAGIPHG
jgi:hypothetical protein